MAPLMTGIAVEQQNHRSIGHRGRVVPVDQLETLRAAQGHHLEAWCRRRGDIGTVARREIEQRALKHEEPAQEQAVYGDRGAEKSCHGSHHASRAPL